MSAPTTADIDNIKLKAYNFNWDNNGLGISTVDTVSVSIGEQVINVDDADQFEGIIKQFSKGFMISVTATFKRSDAAFVWGLLAQNKSTLVSGGGKSYYSIRNKQVDNRADAKVLIMNPANLGTSDRSEDLYMPLAFPTLEDFELVGSRDTPQSVTVSFTIFPDLDNNNELLRVGDWTAVESDPVGIWAAMSPRALVPGKHLDAATIDVDELQQVEFLGAFADDSTTTMLLNDVGGLTAAETDKTIEIDTLSLANAVSVGDYLKLDDGGGNTEYVYVEAITYSTTTSATITAIRDVWGTGLVTLVDNDTITLQENVAVINVTSIATLASATPADVEIGTTVQGSGSAKAGVIKGIQAGSSVITATIGSTVSPDLTVTVS